MHGTGESTAQLVSASKVQMEILSSQAQMGFLQAQLAQRQEAVGASVTLREIALSGPADRPQIRADFRSFHPGSRRTAMLRSILNPQDKRAKDRGVGVEFLQSLTAWGSLEADDTDQSGEAVSDNVRVCVLLEHAPEPYREVIRQAPEEVKLTFEAARSHIRCYYNQGRAFSAVCVRLRPAPQAAAVLATHLLAQGWMSPQVIKPTIGALDEC